MEKHINIGGKEYTLTANRKIIKTIYNVSPEFLDIIEGSKVGKKQQSAISIELIANVDTIFFDMIKIAHPHIDKEESDKILEQFCQEYEGVDNALINFAISVFTDGNQGSAKKKIQW